MKFGHYVTVDDSGNYFTFHELNVRIKIKCHVSQAECLHNNSSQQELRLPVPHTTSFPGSLILLLLGNEVNSQVNFRAWLYDLKNRLAEIC